VRRVHPLQRRRNAKNGAAKLASPYSGSLDGQLVRPAGR
jgi:hypothetical protein